MTVSQKVQLDTYDHGASLSDVAIKALLSDATVTGGTADTCNELAVDSGVYVAEFINADAAALIPAGDYRLRAVVGGKPINRYVRLTGVDGELVYAQREPFQAGIGDAQESSVQSVLTAVGQINTQLASTGEAY